MYWEAIHWKADTFQVLGKGEGGRGNGGGKIRTVPLFPAFKALLLRLKAEFRAEHGRDPLPTERIIPTETADAALSHACKRLGFPLFGHHDMRHFFCTNAIEAGVDFKTIAGWLGHSDGGILVAKTYGHLRQEFSQQMAKKMTFGIVTET